MYHLFAHWQNSEPNNKCRIQSMKNYVLLLLTTNCVTVNFDPLIAELKNVTVKFEPLETMYHCSNAWNKKLTFLSLAHCWPCWNLVPAVHRWEPRSGDRRLWLHRHAERMCAEACEVHQVHKAHQECEASKHHTFFFRVPIVAVAGEISQVLFSIITGIK